MKTSLNCFRLLLLLGIWMLALPSAQAKGAKKKTPSEPVALKPSRETLRKEGYIIDAVGDKKQDPESETIRLVLRITREAKQPIKPEDIVLLDPQGQAIEPQDRDDRDVGNEENSGLPLSVSPGVNSGGGGVGIGLDLGKLFGGGGVYSYTKVDFFRKDFVSGMKLKITMPEEITFIIPLTAIAKPAKS